MGVRAHRIKTVNQMIVVGGWVQKTTKLIDDIVDLTTVVHVARPYHRTIAGRATLLLNKHYALKAIAKLYLIHISKHTRQAESSYPVFL